MLTVHMQSCFARSNKMVSKKYLDLTEKHFDAMTQIRRLMSDDVYGRFVHEGASDDCDREASASSSDVESVANYSASSSSDEDPPSDSLSASKDKFALRDLRTPRYPGRSIARTSAAIVDPHHISSKQAQWSASHSCSTTSGTAVKASPKSDVDAVLQIASRNLNALLQCIRSSGFCDASDCNVGDGNQWQGRRFVSDPKQAKTSKWRRSSSLTGALGVE